MADLKCPTGMVLINPKGAVHPDEPAFCINKTEVPQEDDNRFWATRLRKGFELLIKLVGGGTKTVNNAQEAPLRKKAAKLKKDRNVSGVEIKPVVAEAKLQPEGRMAGPRKPAVFRTWAEAREFCRGTYRGGDLPTERQWENACGSKKYCTRSGELNHAEAIYDVEGPADVGSTPSNPQGVHDMTGNVNEWTRDGAYSVIAEVSDWKRLRGGSWGDYFDPDILRADGRFYFPFDDRGYDVGFRCVAPPLSSSTQPATGKVEAPLKDSKKSSKK